MKYHGNYNHGTAKYKRVEIKNVPSWGYLTLILWGPGTIERLVLFAGTEVESVS